MFSTWAIEDVECAIAPRLVARPARAIDGRHPRALTASPVAGSHADWSRRDSDALASAWSTSARGGARGVILGASRCRALAMAMSANPFMALAAFALGAGARASKPATKGARGASAGVGRRRSHGGEWEFNRAFTRSGRRCARANPRTRTTRREKQCADEGKPQSRADDD